MHSILVGIGGGCREQFQGSYYSIFKLHIIPNVGDTKCTWNFIDKKIN